MNKKGFTLVEVIVVIGLLAIFGVAIGISLNRNMKKNQENSVKEFNQKIIGAANLYASNNENILTNLYEEKGFTTIKINDLIDAGLISDNIVNPETNKKVTGEEPIRIELDSAGTINVEFPVKTTNEDHLQTKTLEIKYEELQTIKDNEDLLKDKICYNNKIENGIITDTGLRYIKADGTTKDLEKNVNIRCNIDSVKPDQIGTYEIKYDYETDDGTWKQATRTIIIVDEEGPTCPEIETTGIKKWTKEARKVEIECTDNYRCENNIVSKTFINTKYGEITISDISNNTINCTVNVYSDNSAPKDITISKSPNTEWAKSVTLTGKAKDELSGIKYYQFSTNSNLSDISSSGTKATESDTQGEESISKTKVINKEGKYTYYFYVQDLLGNIGKSKKISIKIDKAIPVITTASTTTKGNEVKIRATDSGSGVAEYCTVNTNSSSGCTWTKISDGPKQDTGEITITNKYPGQNIYIFVKDAAGNISASKNVNTSCIEITYKDGETCTAKCGGGTYNLLAIDKYTGARCDTKNDKSSGGSACNTMGCCTKTTKSCGTWSWSSCSSTNNQCGTDKGTRYQYRTCKDVSDYNGQVCKNNYTEKQNENSKCNVDCCSKTTTTSCTSWRYGTCSAWGNQDGTRTCYYKSAYSNSTASCGSGTETTSRSCTPPTTKTTTTESSSSCNLPYDYDRGINPCALCDTAGMSTCTPAGGSDICAGGTNWGNYSEGTTCEFSGGKICEVGITC